MTGDFLTNSAYANDANLDIAKMWDGDKTKQGAWLSLLDEDIEAVPQLRDIVFRGTVALRDGKIAVDSKSEPELGSESNLGSTNTEASANK